MKMMVLVKGYKQSPPEVTSYTHSQSVTWFLTSSNVLGFSKPICTHGQSGGKFSSKEQNDSRPASKHQIQNKIHVDALNICMEQSRQPNEEL